MNPDPQSTPSDTAVLRTLQKWVRNAGRVYVCLAVAAIAPVIIRFHAEFADPRYLDRGTMIFVVGMIAVAAGLFVAPGVMMLRCALRLRRLHDPPSRSDLSAFLDSHRRMWNVTVISLIIQTILLLISLASEQIIAAMIESQY
ncbi:MAG: hypothetical protein R3F11_11890 [Verrucomicrobiales bacterium]